MERIFLWWDELDDLVHAARHLVFRNLPHLDEVSIGHAIWAEALFHGIDHVVSDYLALLAGAQGIPDGARRKPRAIA
jgi:hypothetical protein